MLQICLIEYMHLKTAMQVFQMTASFMAFSCAEFTILHKLLNFVKYI